MTDTHTHLYLEDFAGDEEAAVRRALAAGVRRLVFPNVCAATVGPMRRLHEAFPENTVMGIGLHPSEITSDWPEVLSDMEQEMASGKYSAVGEVGLDLHWPDSPPIETQKEVFLRQLQWGHKYGLSVIIHCRDARDECLETIDSLHQQERPVMIFHSFTGTSEDVEEIRRHCDPYFGVNGVVTFKNAPELRQAVKAIGADRLVLETDSPYLAPVPHRGSRNESAYIPAILNACAAALGLEPAELETVTDRNAEDIFKFP